MLELDVHSRLYIFKQVGTVDLTNLKLTCKEINSQINQQSDSIYKQRLYTEFGVSTLDDILQRNEFKNYGDAYKYYYSLKIQKYGSLVSQAIRVIKSLTKYFKNNFQEVYETFQEGVSEEQLDQFNTTAETTLPQSLRLLYRLLNGQAVPNGIKGIYYGALGGHFVYNQRSTTFLLSIEDISFAYKQLNISDLKILKKRIIFASDTQFSKTIMIDDNQTCVWCGKDSVSFTPLYKVQQEEGANDALFTWLGMYVSNLESGMFNIQNASGQQQLKAVSLYPQKTPMKKSMTTNGIEISAAVALIPESSYESDNNFTYAYQISMSMPFQQGQEEGQGQDQSRQRQRLDNGEAKSSFKRQDCYQLFQRRWFIHPIGQPQEEVYDKAVIGMYPILYPGCPEFKYCSQVQFSKHGGYMDGYFEFFDKIQINQDDSLVPYEGPKSQPSSKLLKIECPRFFMKLLELNF